MQVADPQRRDLGAPQPGLQLADGERDIGAGRAPPARSARSGPG